MTCALALVTVITALVAAPARGDDAGAPSTTDSTPTTNDAAPTTSDAPTTTSEAAPTTNDAASTTSATAPSPTPARDDGIDLGRDVVPWVTTAAGAVFILGGALLGFAGALPALGAYNASAELAALEASDPSAGDVERAQLLQGIVAARRRDWLVFGAPATAAGAAFTIAGAVFVVGGVYTGVRALESGE